MVGLKTVRTQFYDLFVLDYIDSYLVDNFARHYIKWNFDSSLCTIKCIPYVRDHSLDQNFFRAKLPNAFKPIDFAVVSSLENVKIVLSVSEFIAEMKQQPTNKVQQLLDTLKDYEKNNWSKYRCKNCKCEFWVEWLADENVVSACKNSKTAKHELEVIPINRKFNGLTKESAKKILDLAEEKQVEYHSRLSEMSTNKSNLPSMHTDPSKNEEEEASDEGECQSICETSDDSSDQTSSEESTSDGGESTHCSDEFVEASCDGEEENMEVTEAVASIMGRENGEAAEINQEKTSTDLSAREKSKKSIEAGDGSSDKSDTIDPMAAFSVTDAPTSATTVEQVTVIEQYDIAVTLDSQNQQEENMQGSYDGLMESIMLLEKQLDGVVAIENSGNPAITNDAEFIDSPPVATVRASTQQSHEQFEHATIYPSRESTLNSSVDGNVTEKPSWLDQSSQSYLSTCNPSTVNEKKSLTLEQREVKVRLETESPSIGSTQSPGNQKTSNEPSEFTSSVPTNNSDPEKKVDSQKFDDLSFTLFNYILNNPEHEKLADIIRFTKSLYSPK